MRSGTLRHRIVVEHKLPSSPPQSASGEPDFSWATFLSAMASVSPVSGREPFLAQAHLSEVSHKIDFRHQAGITHDMRVRFGSRIFDIKAILNYGEKNRYIKLLCTEGLTNG